MDINNLKKNAQVSLVHLCGGKANDWLEDDNVSEDDLREVILNDVQLNGWDNFAYHLHNVMFYLEKRTKLTEW